MKAKVTLFLFHITTALVYSQSNNVENCNEQKILDILNNPPTGWTINDLKKEQLDNFICSERLIEAAIDCWEDVDLCYKIPGLEALVDALYSVIDEGRSCPACSPKTYKLLLDSVKTVQRRFPALYTRGLSVFR